MRYKTKVDEDEIKQVEMKKTFCNVVHTRRRARPAKLNRKRDSNFRQMTYKKFSRVATNIVPLFLRKNLELGNLLMHARISLSFLTQSIFRQIKSKYHCYSGGRNK